MNKETVFQSDNGILYNFKQTVITTHYNVDESHRLNISRRR